MHTSARAVAAKNSNHLISSHAPSSYCRTMLGYPNMVLRSSELFGKLLRQRVGGRVCYLVNMALHVVPSFRFRRVIARLQFLNLLDMMAAMRQQDAVKGVLWQVRVCFA